MSDTRVRTGGRSGAAELSRRCGSAVRSLRFAAVFAGAAMVCGCNTDRQITAVPEVSPDYRLRHPISISEADRTLQVFIGVNRGSLNPTQRAEVLAFAQSWKHEATGGLLIDVPAGTANERSSAEAVREIQSIFSGAGVPPPSMMVRPYRVTERTFAPIRIAYPRVVAQAGPCGLWPKDIGPSYGRDHLENQPYWNYGCATQRNLAAMIDNPADLVQPRAETPVYTARRTTVVEKYRQGAATGAQAPSGSSGKITDLGQ